MHDGYDQCIEKNEQGGRYNDSEEDHVCDFDELDWRINGERSMQWYTTRLPRRFGSKHVQRQLYDFERQIL